MNRFSSMGCEVVLSDVRDPRLLARVQALFESRNRRFSRFVEASELNRVNAVTRGVTVVSEELASMLSLSIDAARATDGLVTPAVGGAVIAAGYDRDFPSLSPDGGPVGPAAVPPLAALRLNGRLLLRVEPITLDLNGVVKGRTVDDALALLGGGWVSAGGDLATTVPIVVGLPGGAAVTVDRGGLATSSVAKRTWRRGGETQHHLIDPATGAPARSRWRDVTVAAATCLDADVAAKAALLLDDDGPAWLDEHNLAGRFVDKEARATANRAWTNLVPAVAAA